MTKLELHQKLKKKIAKGEKRGTLGIEKTNSKGQRHRVFYTFFLYADGTFGVSPGFVEDVLSLINNPFCNCTIL